MRVAYGYRYPPRPAHLPELNAVEERLISPRLPFISIRRLTRATGQYGPYDSTTTTTTNPTPLRLSTKGLTFKGFVVKAVDQHGKETGHFLPGDLYQPLKMCTAATHVDRQEKTFVTMRWQAPSDTSGEVHFL
ncbi:uncharacterized protein LOC144180022 [Haemaphysalis longicornis]